MRVGLVRKIGFTLVALGVVGLGGCNDDPLDFDEQTAVRMFTNPSFMVVQTGDSVQLVANGINAGNEPTFQAVTATVASCGGSGSISVIESDQQTAIQPPQIYEVIGGAALGGACVVVQSGSITDTVDVVVVGGTLNVVSAPSLIIAGTGGTVVVELVGLDGNPVTPFDPTDVTWSSDNTAVLTVDDSGNFTSPGLSGSATITATWTGTDATGTSGQGVVLTAPTAVTVKPDIPIAAAFGTTFAAVGAGGSDAVAILVTDQFGNQVVDSLQVLGISVMSDDVLIATAVDNYAPDALGSLAVTATGVAAGVANISGIVTTSGTSADLPYGPEPVFVLDPQITLITPDNGNATGETGVVITGTGLEQAGFATTVTLDGNVINKVTVDSDTQITIDVMPSADGAAGAKDVVVDVGGISSPAGTWTQNEGGPDDTTEPANDNPGASFVTLPLQLHGSVGQGANDIDDFFEFTLGAPANVSLDMAWVAATGDLDLLVTDAGVTAFQCGFVTATGAIPESGTCALGAGGFQLWVNDYGHDGPVRNYTLEVDFIP